MMEKICEYPLCTGCSACMNVCPKDAIHMSETGTGGYIYPVIDPERCIDCGLCTQVCPVNHPLIKNKPLTAYAARFRNPEEYNSSASGGAASALAYAIITTGGVVYGCEMENYHSIKHNRYERAADILRMKGSKYVQSEIGYVFRMVKRDLQDGRKVLFTGTPCQVAGLKNYLRKTYDNLYCVDLVCHGVPSQKLLRDNVENLCRNHGVRPTDELKVYFREKSPQTSGFFLRFGVYLKNQIHPIPLGEQEFPNNDYITAFMSGIIFRDNCFTCPYACKERVSDVTVADYWGLGEDCSISHPAGISLLLPTTKKGMKLIHAAEQQLYIEERPVTESVKGNGQLVKPSHYPENRDAFFIDYATKGQHAYAPHLKTYRKQYAILQKKNAVHRILSKIPYLKVLYKQIKQRIR